MPSLDLNLMPALHALLDERSVTRAAQRLGLSQPALSASLARLRRHFGDELLVRVGNSYELTPVAVELQARAVVAMADAERLFSSQSLFEPATSRRTFRLLASDYAIAVIGGAVADVMGEQAPDARVQFDLHTPDAVGRGEATLRGVDGMLLPMGFLADLPQQPLFSDDWVCLVSDTNEGVGDELPMEQLAQLPWVYTYLAPEAFTPAGRQLQIMGVEPRVVAVVQSFLALPFLVQSSDRIGLLQRRLVERLPTGLGLRVLPCPFDAVAITEALWWHPIHDREPEHAWLRSVFATAAARVDTVPAGHETARQTNSTLTERD